MQDNPYYEIDKKGNKVLKFEGLTKTEIEDIKKIYDVVIGIDILHNKATKNYHHHSKNISYFSTKILVLGVTLYKKLIYFDSSTIFLKNVDYYFSKYKNPTYRNVSHKNYLKRGLTSNIFLFEPKKYYIPKGLYILENYNNYFLNFIVFKIDENIIYYTIFPDWNDKCKLDNNTMIESYYFYLYRNIDMDIKKNNYEVQLNMGYKPFLYPYDKEIKNKDKFSLNFNIYNIWDNVSKKMLQKFKEFDKYFEHIKTYRYNHL